MYVYIYRFLLLQAQLIINKNLFQTYILLNKPLGYKTLDGETCVHKAQSTGLLYTKTPGLLYKKLHDLKQVCKCSTLFLIYIQ